jgi:ubiquinone/menaquinone biosynthesis C-methylase UbiE
MSNAPNWSRETVEVEQRKYYDAIAPVYDQYYHNKSATAYRAWLYDQNVGHLELRNLKVLDAMCGGGESTAYFLSHGAVVSGQDISHEQCELYRKRYPQCAVEHSSILNTGYPDASFDLVTVESLHHLHPYTIDAMREIARLLKPGGNLLLWEPCSGSIADLARKLWYRLDRRCFLPNEAAINLAELLGASREFEIISERYGGNFEFLLVFSSMHLRIPQDFVRYYAPVCHFLEKAVNRLNWRFLACWMLVLLRKCS